MRTDRHRSRVRFAALVAGAALVTGTVGCSDPSDGGATSATSATTVEPTASSPVGAEVRLAAGDDVVASVDERFQSYNIEMVEVTGGEFWQPYDAGEGKVGRPPLDLSSERLRNLARALGPAYIRVSGSWANSTYFDPDGEPGDAPPEGFGGLLTGDQWIGVGEFARAVDGEVTTSFASNDAVRDPSGGWHGDQAEALLAFSADHDVPLVAAELFNEPGLPVGMPTGYDGEGYARDVETFLGVVDEAMPDLQVVGPGATADVVHLMISPSISGEDLAEGSKPRLDAFSYHFYPNVSERCGSEEGPEVALTPEYLSRIDETKAYYEGLRDEVAPGAPMWITETAQAACGGDRWASTYRDVIRYVDTLGRLATGDGDVVFHNTLAASDYGLIDEDGLEPRPDYWAAVLWAKLMGPEVLAPGDTDQAEDVTTYAHCRRDGAGVAYAVVNASPDQSRTVATESGTADVYLLTGDLDGNSVALNGTELVAGDDGTLPDLDAERVDGAVEIPPASVAYVVDPKAGGGACA
ncbi:MAG TPA: hypothetical protein VNS19_21010 [Acidimicrobiales bacterium]|nr:hypothetical protein [Acidimicrobiales bacterium]